MTGPQPGPGMVGNAVEQPAMPAAVILARIETMLDHALREQTAHRTLLDQLATAQTNLANRVTVVETRTADVPGKVDTLESIIGKLPTRASLATAYGTALAAIAALISFLALYHTGK